MLEAVGYVLVGFFMISLIASLIKTALRLIAGLLSLGIIAAIIGAICSVIA